MQINNNKIPLLLESLILENKWTSLCTKNLSKILRSNNNHPQLYSFERMKRETFDVISTINEIGGNIFKGHHHNNIFPGKVLINNVILIGQIEVEEPFALYYYDKNEPIVIHFADIDNFSGIWRKVASSFDEFYFKLANGIVDPNRS